MSKLVEHLDLSFHDCQSCFYSVSEYSDCFRVFPAEVLF